MNTLLDEPPPPTLGTIMDFVRLHNEAEGKTGWDRINAKLNELNTRYCWTPGLRNKAKTNWGQVNRHIWRIRALYHGGDCFFAGWEGAVPNQRVYPATTCNSDAPGAHKKQHYGATLPAYRQPRVT